MGRAPIKAALSGAAFLFFCVAGCASLDSFDGLRQVLDRANAQGFVASVLHVRLFRLASWVRRGATPEGGVTVYIEGDGAAWPTPHRPPQDPTPRRPTAFAMALADTSPDIIYLGRPCQYLPKEALQQCDSAWWVERRFAPEVIAAYDDALDRVREAYSARSFRLVGYSGGGVIAVLLAARRNDVASLVTVAAPLAVSEWVALHGMSPLTGSLDPSIPGSNLRLPPSVHFVGGNDKTVPIQIVESFVRRIGGRMEVVPHFDHECCWARDWPQLLARQSMAQGNAE